MKRINKGNKGGFGEYTPEGVAKKKLQDKRDEQAVNSANNEPKDCGCCWYLIGNKVAIKAEWSAVIRCRWAAGEAADFVSVEDKQRVPLWLVVRVSLVIDLR